MAKQFKKGFHVELIRKDSKFYYCKIIEENQEIRLTKTQFYERNFNNPFKKDSLGLNYGKYAFELLQEDDTVDKLLDERRLWRNMIERVVKNPKSSYKNVTVCNDWYCLSNFLVDVVNLPGYAEWKNRIGKDELEPYHLDKDLRNKDCEIYQYNKNNCWFIPRSINCSYPTIKKHQYYCFNLSTGESKIEYSSFDAFNVSSNEDIENKRKYYIVDKINNYNNWVFVKIRHRVSPNTNIEDILKNNVNNDTFFIIDCRRGFESYVENIYEFMKKNNKGFSYENTLLLLKRGTDSNDSSVFFYNGLLVFILNKAKVKDLVMKIKNRHRKSIDEMRKKNEIVGVNIKTHEITLIGRKNAYYKYNPNYSVNIVDFYCEFGTNHLQIMGCLKNINETAGGHIYYRIDDFLKKYNLKTYEEILAFNSQLNKQHIKNTESKYVATDIKTNNKMYFNTIPEMATYLNMQYDSVRDVLRGRRNSSCGYRFEYNENSSIKKREHYDKNKFGFIGIRILDNYELWFDNQKEFAERFGLLNSKISDVISGRNKTHKGWRFRRATEEEFLQKDF